MLRYNDKVKCFNYNKHITSSQTELQYWALCWTCCWLRDDSDCLCNSFSLHRAIVEWHLKFFCLFVVMMNFKNSVNKKNCVLTIKHGNKDVIHNNIFLNIHLHIREATELWTKLYQSFSSFSMRLFVCIALCLAGSGSTAQKCVKRG